MAMIQFAINSRKNRRMTLKEIYTWFEDNFPYFREVAKPGWKVLGGFLHVVRKVAQFYFYFINLSLCDLPAAEFHPPQPLLTRHVPPRDVAGRQDFLLDHSA